MKTLVLSLKKWLYKLSQKSQLNRNIVLVLDLFLSLACCYLALRMTALVLATSFHWDLLIVLVVLFANLGGVYLFSLLLKTSRQIFRYSSLHIFRQVFFLVLSTTFFTIVAAFLILEGAGYQFVFSQLIHFSLFYFVIGFSAFVLCRYLLIKVSHWVLKEHLSTSFKQRKRLLIYGVQQNSVALSRQLKESHEYRIIGFCTRDKEKSSYQVDGLPIYCIHCEEDLRRVAENKHLNGILFPAERDFLHEKESLIYFCESIRLHTYLMPRISESNTFKITSASIQRIRIEDLLMRDEISTDAKEVCRVYMGKTILVTGAAGSIGSELVKQIADLGCIKKLILFDNAETPLHNIRLFIEKTYPWLELYPIIGDVRSRNRLQYLFNRFHPEIVLHACAYKHVPLMEENPCEGVQVNVVGTRNLADLCLEYNVERMVMVSTDKAVNPTNVMGASKRAAEIYVQSLGKMISTGARTEKTIFVTTRFGNVLGSQGSVIELFRKQIAEGGPLTVTHPEVERYFMSIPEACSLVLQASTLATEATIYVFDMGKKRRITDLAENMIRLAGFEPNKDIEIIYTGLRPGEKLYEEVLTHDEDTHATTIDKIKIAKIRPMEHSSIINYYDQLESLSEKVEILETVKVLKALVPEYKSAHSWFESLDSEAQSSNTINMIQ